MKFIYISFLLFTTSITHGQNKCAIEKIENSNEISYDELEIEKIIDFKKYKAIFYGESHTRDFEPEFKFNFIRHLNKKFGVKDVFMEIGYSAAYFYNLYLNTGDTLILKYNNSIYSNGKYKIFWGKLFKYNKTTPDNLKIKIHGIDFERNEALKLFDTLKIKDALIPKNLITTFEKITILSDDKSLSAFDKRFHTEFSKIKSTFLDNENYIKNIYGENHEILKSILNNKTPTTNKIKPRNMIWFNNISEIIKDKKIEKIVCFFGASHTSNDKVSSITNKIKEIENFKDSILTIKGIYNHFFSYGQMSDTPQIFEFGHKEKEIFEKYSNPFCRATIVLTTTCSEKKLKNKADYIMFAKDIMVE